MEFKSVAFDPAVGTGGSAGSVASDLQRLISSEVSSGWEFVGVQNHSTVVPGSNGCFGFGATAPYPKTFSIAVFKR
ncbi:hypothetical protein RXV86_04315 [Alisedimentitalea sp. MJ-SS2]|uniref:hypothetical protein n=1 Tax=Aliisedimentitalea sp. MJ-SS2 TaxID=3049795 RepID=UPI00290B221E|nr:hypothetical protein [Alisedimentitalea sp. MJ-SS2]MDU8926602.1 hypothetical protein [Alisedimentitalea sp. MJ-SS2]